jgi:hypothetical protein
MAITQGMCSSFKQELLQSIQNFTTDTFKIALYVSTATLDSTTTVYTSSNEVVATGYTAGGQILTGTSITLSGTTAYISFNNVTWSSSSITARGALIYNSSKANRSVAVLDFGADKTSTGGNFIIQFPTNTASTAIIRIA